MWGKILFTISAPEHKPEDIRRVGEKMLRYNHICRTLGIREMIEETVGGMPSSS
jgi:hypothetical protein